MKLVKLHLVILSTILWLSTPSTTTAATIDVGDVGLSSDGSLLVGINAMGQRTLSGGIDGPYTSITVGDNGNSGQLLLMNGASLSTPGSLIVGNSGLYTTGLVQVGGGSTLNTGTAALMPNLAGGTNVSVIVTGVGSTWANSGSLSVGNSVSLTPTTVTVSNGGTIFTSGATLGSVSGPGTSQIIIDGASSHWINSGALTLLGPSSQFIVRNGGAATDGSVYIGTSYSNTQAIVDGAGSKWTTGAMYVGGEFTPLTITNGATVQSASAYVSTETGETIAIDKGGSWKIDGDLTFGGRPGPGGGSSISITNGATLSDRNGLMTLGEGGGIVLVQGAGSQWVNRGDLVLGVGADSLYGRLTIQDGGLVSNVNAMLSCSSCQAQVTGLGSQWISTGSLFIGGDQTHSLQPGTLTVSNGGSVLVGDTLKVWQNGLVSLSDGLVSAHLVNLDGGQLSGKGVIFGDVLNAGVVAPDKLLAVIGNYQQLSSGTLALNLGLSGYDVLGVLGTANILGKIAVQLADYTVGTMTKDFYVLWAKSIDITGAVLDLPQLVAGYMWSVSVVDVTGTGYGQALDLRIVGVPEPSSFLLVALGFALLIGWRFITGPSTKT